MSFFARLGQDIVLPLVALWEVFIEALPGILGGLLILIFGYLLGEVIEVIIVKVLEKFHLTRFVHKLKISKNLEKIHLSKFIGVLVKWMIFVIFLAPAASLAKLGTLSVLLLDFARWVPSLILAILIATFGWIGADVLCNRIESTKVKSKHVISMGVKIFVTLFIGVIALEQVGVNLELLHQTYLILLGSVALGFGLAIGIGYGLALKDEAKKSIRSIKKKL